MGPFNRRGIRVSDKGIDTWGIKLAPSYEDTIKETVEQDLRQPEDANQPEVQNRLKKYGGQGAD